MEADDRSNAQPAPESYEFPETTERPPTAPARPHASSDARGRADKIRAIAAGLNAPAADLNAALAGDITVEAFALAQSDRAANARAKAEEEAEVEAVVSRILNSDGPYASVRALRPDAPPPAYRGESAEAVAARIIAA